MMSHVMELAKKANVRFRAEFVPTDKNRLMYITYKFAGFIEVEEKDGLVILENDLSRIQPVPDYMKLISEVI